MRVSISQAKKMGIWSKVPKNIQKKIHDKNDRKPVKANDPQKTLFNAVKEIIPEAKWEVKGLVPGRKFRADIYIPSSRIVIEFDGYRHHALSKAGFKKGLESQNLFISEGYSVLRYYAKQVFSDLDSVINEIERLHKKKQNISQKSHWEKTA